MFRLTWSHLQALAWKSWIYNCYFFFTNFKITQIGRTRYMFQSNTTNLLRKIMLTAHGSQNALKYMIYLGLVLWMAWWWLIKSKHVAVSIRLCNKLFDGNIYLVWMKETHRDDWCQNKLAVGHAPMIPGIVSQVLRELVEQEAGWWAPKLVWTLWEKKNFLPLPGIEVHLEVYLSCPARGIVTILTALFRL